MILLSLFIGAKAYALTLESHSQKISINNEKTEISSVDPKKCVKSKLSKIPGNIFYSPSVKEGEYVVLRRVNSDTFFCKVPFDYLSIYDVVKGSEKKTWSSKDDFVSLVQMTNEGGIIRRNAEESEAKKINQCNAFPSFFKMITVPSGVMSESLTGMRKGGYLMLSSKFSSLYFFSLDLKKVEFVFNMPGDVRVTDAVVRKNGELIVLSSYEKEQCIERWDLITGTMGKSRCSFKSYDQQLLIDRDKITRAYIQNKTLYFEEFDENFESKTIPVVKGIGEFNLNSAFVY